MSIATTFDWMRLDNAAKIFPTTSRDPSASIFRVSVTLAESLRLPELERALRAMVDRCPYYQVHLRRGFFWFYLQRHRSYPKIELMPDHPMTTISLRRHGEQLMRVLARDRTVAIDFSHVLTDGYGAMQFLGSLVVEYLRLTGRDIPPGDTLMDPRDEPPDDEFEDAYQRVYRKGPPKAPTPAPAYHVGGVPYLRGYRTVNARMPLDQALATAKRYGGTLTEYLVAAYMCSIADIHRTQAASVIKPRSSIIRIEVPVNMRRLHPSATMRNFSLFVSPEIDLRLGDYSRADVVRRVHHQMNIQVDANELARQIVRNVGGERLWFVRVLPRVVKYAYLVYVRRTVGDRSYSGVLSNLGPFNLPPEAAPFVSSAGMTLGPSPHNKTCCAVASFNGVLYVTVGSVIQNRAVERGLFRALASDGIDVIVRESAP